MIRVLLIDDDRISLAGLKATLPWQRYDMTVVGEALNGRDGLIFLENHPVDLVMLDLAMPVMDGLTFIRNSRKLHPNLQYVVMTFHESFEYIQEALRLGVIDYISKLKLEEEDQDALMSRIAETVRNRNLPAPDVSIGSDAHEIAEMLNHPLWLCDDLCMWEITQQIQNKNYNLNQLEIILREALIRMEVSSRFSIPEIGYIRSGEDALLYLKDCRQAIARQARSGASDTTEARLFVSASLINDQYNQPLQTQDIAEAAGFSRSYLSSCFSRYFGITINEFIRRKRVYESMLMILSGQKTLLEIAIEVGYESYQYYKKMFIEVRGETPKEFRNRSLHPQTDETSHSSVLS